MPDIATSGRTTPAGTPDADPIPPTATPDIASPALMIPLAQIVEKFPDLPSSPMETQVTPVASGSFGRHIENLAPPSPSAPNISVHSEAESSAATSSTASSSAEVSLLWFTTKEKETEKENEDALAKGKGKGKAKARPKPKPSGDGKKTRTSMK